MNLKMRHVFFLTCVLDMQRPNCHGILKELDYGPAVCNCYMTKYIIRLT